jgi:hypothetical protein
MSILGPAASNYQLAVLPAGDKCLASRILGLIIRCPGNLQRKLFMRLTTRVSVICMEQPSPHPASTFSQAKKDPARAGSNNRD